MRNIKRLGLKWAPRVAEIAEISGRAGSENWGLQCGATGIDSNSGHSTTSRLRIVVPKNTFSKPAQLTYTRAVRWRVRRIRKIKNFDFSTKKSWFFLQMLNSNSVPSLKTRSILRSAAPPGPANTDLVPQLGWCKSEFDRSLFATFHYFICRKTTESRY